MFKQLRNKFLILNMTIITVVMVISFISIYLITYNRVRSEIYNNLREISEFSRKTNENQGQQRPNLPLPKPDISFDIKDRFRQDFFASDSVLSKLNTELGNSYSGNLDPDLSGRLPAEPRKTEPAPRRFVSFTLILDENKNIVDYISALNLDVEFCESAKTAALALNKNEGRLKLDDNFWAFQLRPNYNGFRIVFLDITSQQNFLTQLIYTFALVAFATLIVIFFISRYFANKSIKPIKEAFDKQKQFIADASHELKTPLAVISTNVDVLMSNKEDTIGNQSKWLQYIKSEVERMSKLTKDLLYLTQIDYSDNKLVFSNFNISETVESAVLTMEAIIFEHSISLNYNIEPNLTVYGNSEQIRQVIMILLDNAVKYTNTNGHINVLLKKNHNSVCLSVTNTGEGISEKDIGRIFDRFYRADKARERKNGSYGLGLAIAKTIVEQHKGKIYAKSVLNESTTFYVELPRANL